MKLHELVDVANGVNGTEKLCGCFGDVAKDFLRVYELGASRFY